MSRFAGSNQFWRTVPTASLLMLLGAVFCLFSTIGFLTDVNGLGRQPLAGLVSSVTLAGLVAVGYAYCGTRHPRWLPVVILAHVAATLVIRRAFPAAPLATMPPLEEVEARMDIALTGSMLGIVGGYVLFVMFIYTEGNRYVRLQTEVALAREIHQLLVPTLAARVGGYEFLGMSQASGEVGGDLVDLVEDGRGGWITYVADVSGHGVSSGVLMGMLKSATRMRLTTPATLTDLLTSLNRVLIPLKKPNMFVTFAALASDGEGALRFSLAGHLPILRYRREAPEVEEVHVQQVPLGVLEDYAFTEAPVGSQPGDVFAILTDGLTEVFNSRDEELGLDAIKRLVHAHGEAPLTDLRDHLLAAAQAHGARIDDQTLLLVRHLS